MPSKERFAIGVDLGGTNVKIGIVSESGKIVKKTSLKSFADEGPDRVVKQIVKGISEIYDRKLHNVKAVGIGSPGVVSVEKGTVENPPNFPGWKKVNIAKLIQKEFNLSVFVENDANAAAIGEMIFGAGKKHNSFIMITLGTGVGGGLIINRKIFRGEYGAAGELGHITIDYKGPVCNCGSIGCIETYAGNRYLKARVREELLLHRNSIIWELLGGDLKDLSPKTIQEAAARGDAYAEKVIRDMGIQLGSALASVSNLLDISTFIIGGGVAGFGKPLFEAIRYSLKERVLKSLKPRVKVIPARLKNDAGIKGASSLVFYRS